MELQKEIIIRQDKIRTLMQQKGIDAALFTCNVNLLYAYGQIISGYLYLPVEGKPYVFVKRPNTIKGENVFSVRKPEQIAEILQQEGIAFPETVMLEADELSYNEYMRLSQLFPSARYVNGTPVIRQARATKTAYEIELLRKSAIQHTKAYRRIPSVYRPGMNDQLLSIEIEKLMRLEGCLGVFRVFGQSMEIFMGSLLAGDNAGAPSPYDFALGGEGLDISLPGGTNGTPLTEGTAIMVDFGGNFYGYMHDMTRVFSIGKLSDEAYRAHQVCLEVQDKVIAKAKPGTACEEIYEVAINTVNHHGFADYFMGTKQKAKFIGHGIGLEINEAPVLAPRIKQALEPGMVFALEPKIVLPGIGAVGIENTWVVTEHGSERLNDLSDEIVELKL